MDNDCSSQNEALGVGIQRKKLRGDGGRDFSGCIRGDVSQISHMSGTWLASVGHIGGVEVRSGVGASGA